VSWRKVDADLSQILCKFMQLLGTTSGTFISSSILGRLTNTIWDIKRDNLRGRLILLNYLGVNHIKI